MTALASVLLVLAALTALGLIAAITWTRFDLANGEIERLRTLNERLSAEAAEAWAAVTDAEHRLADAWADQDAQVLARQHDAAAHEGLFPPEKLN